MGTIRPSIGGLLSSSPAHTPRAHTPREKQLEELSRRERIEIFRFQLWRLLDEPSSSLAARIYSVFMLIVIAVSIINFCISTYPEDLCTWVDTEGKSLVGSSDGVQRTCSYRRFEDYDSPEIIETVCIMLFTAEYLLRALCCGTMMSFWRFLIEPLNILDLLAILPWYITTIMLAVTLSGGGEQDKSKVGQVMSVLRIVRFTRVFRVLKA